MPVYKLDAGRVPIFWDLIKPGLILGRNISGVQGDWDFANKVLEAAICNKCTIWLGFNPGEIKGDNYVGFAITYPVEDFMTGGRDLVLYFGYTYRAAGSALRNEAAISLVKEARKEKCRRLIAYTDNEGMKSILQGFLGEQAKHRSLFYVDLED